MLRDGDRAERLAREAVEVAAGLDDDRAASAAVTVLADVYSFRGQHQRAIASYEEAVTLRTRLGDPLLVTDAVYNLGMAAFHAGDHSRARREFEHALVRGRDTDEVLYVAAAQLMLAEIDLIDGSVTDAAIRVRESLGLYSDLGDDRSRARCLVVLAATLVEEGSHDVAAQLLGAAEDARGDEAPDEFEIPVLDRYLPELEAGLGPGLVAERMAEGRALGRRALDTAIVSADSGA
jgi:tetratricopeptide (TPR) repeat protein